MLKCKDGDKIIGEMPNEEEKKEIEVIKVTDKRPFGYENYYSMPIMVVSDEKIETLYKTNGIKCYLQVDNADKVQDEIEKINNEINIKDIKFNFDKMEIYKNNEKINMTSLEIKILNLLFENLNKVVTREYLIECIWNWTGNDVNDNTITVYLKRIRKKIGNDIIITVKGIGYRIDEK